MKKSVYIASLCFLTAACLSTQKKADTTKSGMEEFPFDQKRAAQTAGDLMEKFWKDSSAGEAAKPENNPKNKLNMEQPKFIAKNITDCDKRERKMVTVVFPDKQGTGSAWVRLFLEDQGVFSNGENIGDTTDTVEQTLTQQSHINCEAEEP